LPQFVTWRVSRVVNGQRTQVGDLGPFRCCPAGNVLAVSTKRDGEMVFSVDGKLVLTLTDPALAEATSAGVVASGPDATKAVVTNFKVIHRVPNISTTTTSAVP
jgi:hypothetical protein